MLLQRRKWGDFEMFDHELRPRASPKVIDVETVGDSDSRTDVDDGGIEVNRFNLPARRRLAAFEH